MGASLILSANNWLLRFLSIKGQVSPAVEQNSSFTQDIVTKEFPINSQLDPGGMAYPIQLKRTPKWMHQPWRVAVLGDSHTSDTLVKRLERRSRQRLPSPMILELFIKPDRDLMATWLISIQYSWKFTGCNTTKSFNRNRNERYSKGSKGKSNF